MKQKAQTATEYLVILAVVVILSVLVVGTLSDVIGLGGGMDERTARLTLAAQTVAITEYVVSDYDIDLTLKNNHNNQIEVDEIWINNEQCLFFIGTVHRLNPGQTKNIMCQTVYELEDTSVEYPVVINWTDTSTGSTYTQSDSEAVIVGAVSNEYLSKLQGNSYWNGTNGCWDTSPGEKPICTCLDLQRINTDGTTRGYDYALQNSIDMQRCADTFGGAAVDYAANWTPIGGNGGAGVFSGEFDGQNSIIKNLYISSGNDEIGLFGDSTGSQISRLGVVDAEVQGNDYVGIISGRGNNFSETFATGTGIGGFSYVGGLVGSSDGLISNSYTTVNIISPNGVAVGGLVGFGDPIQIYNSHATGNIDADSYVGGIGGYFFDAEIRNSYSTGVITGNTSVGGLTGGMNNMDAFSGNSWLNNSDDANNCVANQPAADSDGTCTLR